ncbi:unnamed protein product [marine sediment metagenome]|uniref:Uncharacterized protein n=1 Tax=marine sediment metagenome TaxID=412755 RepID=X1V2T9_9ZZZZ
MNSEQLKAIITSYWRYVMQCPVVALEVSSSLSSYSDDERADILVVNKNRLLIETEVKVSLGDLRKDRKKSKHLAFRNGGTRYPARYFYFAVPREIANAAKIICDDFFPYAGILGSDGSNELGVLLYRTAKPLAGKKLTFPQALRMAFGQSATVCRLANKVEELTRVLKRKEQELKEYRDLKRLEGG